MKKYLLSTLILAIFCAFFTFASEAHAGTYVAPDSAMDVPLDYSSPEALAYTMMQNANSSNPTAVNTVNQMANHMTGGTMTANQLAGAIANGSATVSVGQGYYSGPNGAISGNGNGGLVYGGTNPPTFNGNARIVVISIFDPHTGETIRFQSKSKPDCDNPLEKATPNTITTPPPGWDNPIKTPPPTGGPNCDCVSDIPKPAIPAKPPNAPIPAPGNTSAFGYASAVATNYSTGKSSGGSSISLVEDGFVRSLTQEAKDEMFKNSTDFVWAKPGDEVQIQVSAKAAVISGYTTGVVQSTKSDIPSRRKIIADDVGHIFTGTASAAPITASLFWSANYSNYVLGYNAVRSSRDCPYNVPKTCYRQKYDSRGYALKNPDGSPQLEAYRCDYTAYQHCEFISGWNPYHAQYLSSWTPHYSQSGSISRVAGIKVPHNYKPCLPGDPDPDCSPPSVKKCNEAVENCAPDEPDWPNYGIVYPGHDAVVDDPAFTQVSIIPIPNANFDKPHATNTRPSTYEIISFVTTPDSKQPGKAGTGNYHASTPASGSSCSHYTASVRLARGCVVVQRETGIYFNTATNGGQKGVDLSGKTDSSSYDINGKALKSLNPSIVIDDLPPGTKVCMALSVWPAGSHDNNPTGLNQDAKGGIWKHGAPYCRTIAKKPTVQFWGADIYSAAGITTSQSVKYVPYASGFTASSASNGLSSNDSQNRRAFGSWGEYAVIAGGTIKGIGSGASLGYEGPFGKTLALPGGFPTTYPASNTFAQNRACSYSRLTISNTSDPSNECTSEHNLGNSNINTNIGIILERLLSRYTTPPCNDVGNPTTITIGSTKHCSASPDGVVTNYASGSTDVTLNGSGGTINVPKGKTYTVTVPGKLTIVNNIVYDANNYNNITDLPQVVIFADSIDIAPNVTQIDAWLIVGENNGSSNAVDRGILNTCNTFTVGSSADNFTRGSTTAGCHDQLTINGPVFARKLLLNRTAGADEGHDSSNPAERFNLRADSYLWSYAQAQRYSQAVVTYTRELAPRY